MPLQFLSPKTVWKLIQAFDIIKDLFIEKRVYFWKKGLLLKKDAKFQSRDAPEEPKEGPQGIPNWTPKPPGKNPIDLHGRKNSFEKFQWERKKYFGKNSSEIYVPFESWVERPPMYLCDLNCKNRKAAYLPLLMKNWGLQKLDLTKTIVIK